MASVLANHAFYQLLMFASYAIILSGWRRYLAPVGEFGVR